MSNESCWDNYYNFRPMIIRFISNPELILKLISGIIQPNTNSAIVIRLAGLTIRYAGLIGLGWVGSHLGSLGSLD